jgi:DNA-binding CsgD family transcriptional regulator
MLSQYPQRDMAAVSMEDFTKALPHLIGMIGEQGFIEAFDTALRNFVEIDITCMLGYAPHSLPVLLHNGMQSVSPPEVMQRYLTGTYLLDCVYTACKAGKPAGLYRLRELAPDAFFEGDYYNSPHVHPCISLETGSLAEEIVYLAPLNATEYVAHSLMRQNGSAPFSVEDFRRLTGIEPQVRALLARHHRGLQFSAGITNGKTQEAGSDIEPAFNSFHSDDLTVRERTIVSLVLRGHSSLSIAGRLGITEGTVKIHRKHIYAKLAISSQAELFAMFVRHAVAKP